MFSNHVQEQHLSDLVLGVSRRFKQSLQSDHSEI